MAEAAAAAVTGDILLRECPGFKVSAGVREEGTGEARAGGGGWGETGGPARERGRAGSQEN